VEIPAGEKVQRIIDMVSSRGAEFVELFFENSTVNSIRCEDGKIEKITSGIDRGIGLRAVFEGRTIYGYTNSFDESSLESLARKVSENVEGSARDPVQVPRKASSSEPSILVLPQNVSLEEKARYVAQADRAAREASGDISQVQVRYGDSLQEVAIFNSDGVFVEDRRHQIVFAVVAIAADGTNIQAANRSMGGTVGMELFDGSNHLAMAVEAAESAARMLRARSAPAGRMTVVLSSKAGGTMIHEAIGHGLEGDAIEKGLSIYSGRLGELVASEEITVVDDATLDGRRGSYAFDDEGTPSERTVLVEKGVLRGFMLDLMTAKKMGLKSTGNGRRESYRFKPIVRMSNTMITPGRHDPGEIISSVERGIYVVKMGGGQVETSSGDFVFKVSEAYLIEKGRVTEPVRGATLIGNGPQILKDIDMVGNDLGFDIGTCGKDGQHVPVADAQPTLRIPSITVGGEV